MTQLVWRPYRSADARAVKVLIHEVELAAGRRPTWTTADVDVIVTAMLGDPSTDSRLLYDSDEQLIAAGIVPTPPAGGNRLDLLGGVHPDRRRRGIGRQLLGWQVDRAAQIHRVNAPTSPWYIEIGANAADVATVRLLSQFGLSPASHISEMLAPAGGAPGRAMPGALRCQRYTPALDLELYAAYLDTFGGQNGFQPPDFEEWLDVNVRSDTFMPELSMIALDGQHVVTYIFAFADVNPGRVYIGCGGTRPGWRRRGVAAALLSEVVATVGAAGVPFVSLHTDSENPFGLMDMCERIGFRERSRFVTYRMSLNAQPSER